MKHKFNILSLRSTSVLRDVWGKIVVGVITIAVTALVGCALLLPQFGLLHDALSTVQLSQTAAHRAENGPEMDRSTLPIEAQQDQTQLGIPLSEQRDIDLEDIAPLCGGLAQEAEDGLLSGFFTIGNDGQASGNRYVHVPQGWGDRFAGLDEAEQVRYCITVPSDGQYQLVASAYAQGASNNSLYVQIDGAPSSGYLWNVEQNNSYVESNVTDSIMGEPVVLDLAAGRHTLSFFLREDDTRLDRFELVPMLSAASIADARTTRMNETATGIMGTVVTNRGLSWLAQNSQPRVSDLRVNIVDVATDGQKVNQTILTDSSGAYRIENIEPGTYSVSLEVPDGHRSIGPDTLTVLVAADQLRAASFDLLDMGESVALLSEESPEQTAPAINGDSAPGDSLLKNYYFPVIGQ